MSRVPWTRYSGDDVEAVVAIMLCSQNPSATLVRPARGDGGLDVIVPTAVSGLYDVYQVKKFAEALTSGQKRQIRKSLDSVHNTHLEGDIKVRNWYLTLPLDPTTANLAWLAELEEAVPFNCEWRGLAFVDSLAAAYPNVIDYYLRDSKDRLQAAVRDLALLRSVESAGEAIVGVDDLKDALESIQSLTDSDPHFRYALHLWPHKPEVVDKWALFTATWHQPQLDQWFSIGVYPRFAEALQFRPVTMNVTFNVPPDTPDRVEFDKWRMYGRPFTAGPDMVEVSADFPLGLGWERASGVLSFSGQQVTDEVQLRVFVSSSETGPVTSVVMNVRERAIASDGKGGWMRASDDAEILNLELHFREDEHVNFSFTPGDLTGKAPAKALPTLRFNVALHAGTHMALAPAYGPIPNVLPRLDAPGDNGTSHADHDLIADFAEALARLQEHIPTQVLMPDLSEVPMSHARQYIHFGKLLAGQVVEDMNPLRLCMNPGAVLQEGTAPASATTEVEVTWEDVVYPLGTLYIYGAEVATERGARHDDHNDWLLRPVSGKPLLHTFDPAALPVSSKLLPAAWPVTRPGRGDTN